ncbi:MAG: hypothetical protein WC385_00605 [Candidatus Paceibacterota bacterium]|jgi:hypothetical protein
MDFSGKKLPFLFNEYYQGGLLQLVSVEEAADEVAPGCDLKPLVDLWRFIGGVRLVPKWPEDWEGVEIVDVDEEESSSSHPGVPLRFLKNIPGTKLASLSGKKEVTELADGPVRVDEEVWLMSLKRLEEEILPGLDDIVRAELTWQIAVMENLRRTFPSTRYLVLAIEANPLGDHCLLQTPKREKVLLSAHLLVPCNRAPKKRRFRF